MEAERKEKFVRLTEDLKTILSHTHCLLPEDYVYIMQEICSDYNDLYIKPTINKLGLQDCPIVFHTDENDQQSSYDGLCRYDSKECDLYLSNIYEEGYNEKALLDRAMEFLLSCGHEKAHYLQHKYGENKEASKARITGFQGCLKSAIYPMDINVYAQAKIADSIDNYFKTQIGEWINVESAVQSLKTTTNPEDGERMYEEAQKRDPSLESKVPALLDGDAKKTAGYAIYYCQDHEKHARLAAMGFLSDFIWDMKDNLDLNDPENSKLHDFFDIYLLKQWNIEQNNLDAFEPIRDNVLNALNC